MHGFLFFCLFLLGLAAGSFLNVIIWRYEEGAGALNFSKLGGRSKCPKCRKILNWHELIPLFSFFVQRGRCRNCKWRLSFQYPIVELAGGIVFVLIPLFLNNFFGKDLVSFFGLALPFWYYFLIFFWVLIFLVLILIVAIDIRHYLIPDDLNIALAVLGIASTFLIFFMGEEFLGSFRTSFLRHLSLIFPALPSVFLSKIFGAVANGLFFGFLFFVSRGRAMGFGDVKLAAALGLVLGWPDVVLASLLSFMIGGLWGVFLISIGSGKLKDKLPFAPFLFLGFAFTFFFGFEIVSCYLQIFNL